MKKYVNVNGVWKTVKKTYVNINGTWKNAKEYVNVNGTWLRLQGEPEKKNLQTEYNEKRIIISNSHMGDVTSNIGVITQSNLIKGTSKVTDHLPIIKLLYHNPQILKFKASSNYTSSRHEFGFGAVLIYIKTNGQQSSYTIGAYEKRTYYSDNKVNNNLSVITRDTYGINDPAHCRSTNNRVSAISATMVDSFDFELNVLEGYVKVNNHQLTLSSDFAYATQVWITPHGWYSTDYGLYASIQDLYML